MASRREREDRAFGAVQHWMPSRQGDKNNRYLVGHAAFGQGLTLLERCEFEDASVSLEGAWSVWREVFVKEAQSSSDSESGEDKEAEDAEEVEPSVMRSPSSSSSGSSKPPVLRARVTPLEASAKRFFQQKRCRNLGRDAGGRLPPKRVNHAAEAALTLRGFEEEPDIIGDETHASPMDDLSTSHLDTFARCFHDALALRIRKAAEDEAFACALEAQKALGGKTPVASEDEQPGGDEEEEEEEEEEELTTESYNQMMYKRDVQMMMKPAEAKVSTAPQRVIGAKPQFHHFRRLMRGLCHCYVRLRRWAELDRIIEEAMPYFGHPVGSLRPASQRFKTPAMEDLWISLNLQKAIACLLVGQEHYPKARKLLESVREIEPKRRSLACAFRSIRFLQEQVQSGAMDLTVADKDVLLTNALIALKES